jgi:hypothetical protein
MSSCAHLHSPAPTCARLCPPCARLRSPALALCSPVLLQADVDKVTPRDVIVKRTALKLIHDAKIQAKQDINFILFQMINQVWPCGVDGDLARSPRTDRCRHHRCPQHTHTHSQPWRLWGPSSYVCIFLLPPVALLLAPAVARSTL